MRILLWHVHGGWTDGFVRGTHEYLLPTLPEAGPWGLGRGGRDWPANVIEVAPESLRDAHVDVVVLQRVEEIEAAERLLGRRPGRDIPAIFVEHNTPKGDVPTSTHPLGGQSAIPIAHVTHFNELFWDNGEAPHLVIEHGVRDPGYLYTGALERIGVVINEPVRRWRVTGTDLLPRFADLAPVDVFGMGSELLDDEVGGGVSGHGDVSGGRLHAVLAERRLYLHPLRWTSLGLSLMEAMMSGMPAVALATTEALRAVPAEAGTISTDVSELRRAAAALLADPDLARSTGRAAREVALTRYGLPAFLDRWDTVLADLVDARPGRGAGIPVERSTR